MTVTTDDTGVSVAPTNITETAHDKAVKLVEQLRENLHRAARQGKLNIEVAHGIAYSFIDANAALAPAGALIMFASAIEAETLKRRTDPGQDCGNPMGQTNVPSCAELVLTEHENIVAATLAESLVSGPWPLF